ncbi:hypothetical protein [Blastochloris sulfoviridis]|uniref:Uncharacterized protein n=1 Tax=Blastochloris sulfoviridis TaxID=50712 RepID=A0A5M6HIR8_9HYPH|nr:hypothetical protein [Blastochloris sulfoviridis]KAA5595508.1 hypothetical protein F1193_16535 [Blastochloris sulfoviridis]
MLHVDLPTRTQIDKLVSYRGGPAVSIYLRTTPLTQDAKADRIELKNLLKSAVAELEAAGTAKRSIWPIQESVEALVEDDDFWATQANSLAVFVTPDAVQTFRLPNKLTNIVEVSDRFHLTPLLRSVTFPHHAYVLAIGIGTVRLVEVSADLPPHEVSVPGLPRDFGHALGKRSHIERDGQMRSGEGTSEHAMLTRYARVVDQALRPLLASGERPLILAASEPLAAIFRTVSSYPHIPQQVIAGSPDDATDHVLGNEARAVLGHVYADQIRVLGELYATREAQGRGTTDIAHAARAATFGAVDTLIVDMDTVMSGTVAEEDGKITFEEQPNAVNYGVIDEITRRVLQAGGHVVAARRADVPGGGPLAVLLRYPV